MITSLNSEKKKNTKDKSSVTTKTYPEMNNANMKCTL